MIRTLKFLFLTVIALAFIVFAIFNRDKVELSLYPTPYTAALPKFLFALGCFALGCIVAWMVMCVRMAKLRHQFSQDRKRVKALENEIAATQSQPRLSGK